MVNTSGTPIGITTWLFQTTKARPVMMIRMPTVTVAVPTGESLGNDSASTMPISSSSTVSMPE